MEILSPKKEFFFNLMKSGVDQEVIQLNVEKESNIGRYINIDGQKLLYFASCSYLGLERDKRLVEGAYLAAQKYGILQPNSRTYLSSPLYGELEQELRKIIPGELVITTTTTLGHCSALPLLIDKEDLIIIDFHAHNSIQMASKLCAHQGTKIKFLNAHNDMDILEKMVQDPKNEQYNKIWFLGDGVYSMQGEGIDIVGLKQILDRNEKLYTYLDDAHGFSWTGKNGMGYVLKDSEALHPKMVLALSMCKGFGCTGGIIAFPNQALKDRIGLMGQTQIFAAPIANPILGAAIAAAKIHLSPEIEILQKELLDLILYFKRACLLKDIPLKTKANTPIQFIEIGNQEKVIAAAIQLKTYGIYCSLASFPSMPRNRGGLRITLTRHLKTEDVDLLIDALVEILNP